MSPIVLYSHRGGNTEVAASHVSIALSCPLATLASEPLLIFYDTVVLIMPIVGDEELHPLVEEFLRNLPVGPAGNYCICELGNFLGLKYDGCRKIAETLFENAGWKKLSCVSIDSMPDLDFLALEGWVDELRSL